MEFLRDLIKNINKWNLENIEGCWVHDNVYNKLKLIKINKNKFYCVDKKGDDVQNSIIYYKNNKIINIDYNV